MTTIPIEPIEGFIDTPEGKLHFLNWAPNGPQIHFLHANGFCAGTYTPLINHLRNDLHVTASDLRGHGASQFYNPIQISGWRVFIDDLKMVIEQRLTPPVIGIGHSLGAMTMYMGAAIYPNLFKSIILLDPVLLPMGILFKRAALRIIGKRGNVPLAKKTRRRRRIFKNKTEALEQYSDGRGIFKTWSQEFIEAYIQCGLIAKDTKETVLACDPELEAQIFEATPLDIWRYAKNIRCPLLAVRGEFSKAFPATSANRLKRICRDAKVQTISGSGHFFPMEKPRECARLILDFCTP